MNCIKNNLCHNNTLFCCYSCEVMKCETKNDCNEDECENHPNYGKVEDEASVTITLAEYNKLKEFKSMYEGLMK